MARIDQPTANRPAREREESAPQFEQQATAGQQQQSRERMQQQQQQQSSNAAEAAERAVRSAGEATARTGEAAMRTGETAVRAAGEAATRTGEEAARGVGALANWSGDPFAFMRNMTAQMDRVFDGLFRGVTPWSMARAADIWPSSLWSPQIEVAERDGTLEVSADVPGVTPDQLQVAVEDGMLTIEGERKEEIEEKDDTFRRSERRYGRFYRSIPLPRGVDTAQAKAALRSGVLKVSIPIAGAREAKRLNVQAEG